MGSLYQRTINKFVKCVPKNTLLYKVYSDKLEVTESVFDRDMTEFNIISINKGRYLLIYININIFINIFL